MSRYVYMLTTFAGRPYVLDGRLPIYWKRKQAIAATREWGIEGQAEITRIVTPRTKGKPRLRMLARPSHD